MCTKLGKYNQTMKTGCSANYQIRVKVKYIAVRVTHFVLICLL